MIHELIDYKPVHSKFLLLGLKQLNYKNVWSLRPLVSDAAAIPVFVELIIVGYNRKIEFRGKNYYKEDLDLLFNAICNTIKEFNDT